jgi:tetratricopeptide (TPR) repeat protein
MSGRLAGGTDILKVMTRPAESRITYLFSESQRAHVSHDWTKSEQINVELLKLIADKSDVKHKDLTTVARRYLSSIVSFDLYFNFNNSSAKKDFEAKTDGFKAFISKHRHLVTSLKEVEKEIIELQLYVALPRADTLNKTARALRRIGRPDLSIELCDFQLKQSRLNYYSLISRSWALGDLGLIEKAISDAELAHKFNPKVGQNYTLVALSRAYRLRFVKHGEIEDFEKSISFAEEALKANRNFDAAQAYVSIASKRDSENPLIDKLKKEFPRLEEYADTAALESAWNVDARKGVMIDATVETEDIEEFEEMIEDIEEVDSEPMDDYFEDYFPDAVDSLRNPRSPHLEP